jgi:hypothetical protein
MEDLRRKNQTEILEIKIPYSQTKKQWEATSADKNKWKTESQSSKIK